MDLNNGNTSVFLVFSVLYDNGEDDVQSPLLSSGDASVVWPHSCGTSKASADASSGPVDCLCGALALINDSLGQTDLYIEDDGAGTSQTPHLNLVALEQQASQQFFFIKSY